MASKGDRIFVANTTGFIHLGNEDVKIERGITRVREGHALYKAAPALFVEAEVHYDTEQATAAPGERKG